MSTIEMVGWFVTVPPNYASQFLLPEGWERYKLKVPRERFELSLRQLAKLVTLPIGLPGRIK